MGFPIIFPSLRTCFQYQAFLGLIKNILLSGLSIDARHQASSFVPVLYYQQYILNQVSPFCTSSWYVMCFPGEALAQQLLLLSIGLKHHQISSTVLEETLLPVHFFALPFSWCVTCLPEMAVFLPSLTTLAVLALQLLIQLQIECFMQFFKFALGIVTRCNNTPSLWFDTAKKILLVITFW